MIASCDIQLARQQQYGEQPSAKSSMIHNYLLYKLTIIKAARSVFMSTEYEHIQFNKWQKQKTVLAEYANEIAKIILIIQ